MGRCIVQIQLFSARLYFVRRTLMRRKTQIIVSYLPMMFIRQPIPTRSLPCLLNTKSPPQVGKAACAHSAGRRFEVAAGQDCVAPVRAALWIPSIWHWQAAPVFIRRQPSNRQTGCCFVRRYGTRHRNCSPRQTASNNAYTTHQSGHWPRARAQVRLC